MPDIGFLETRSSMRPSMDPSYLYYKNTRECYLPVTSNKSTANKIERKEMKDLNEFL